ncbi:MAG: 3-deoxy-D-manno-octulosonic acid kinase [Woeseiaceae bacterium]
MGWFTSQEFVLAPGIYDEVPAYLFAANQWPECSPVSGSGRGSAWFVADETGRYVFRHYRRGGLIGRLLTDQYLFGSGPTTRSLAEFRLLDQLHCLGLPVPEPIAARYVLSGRVYRGDLITRRIESTRSLADELQSSGLPADAWKALGALLRRFHDAGAYHADLNAHNILRDSEGRFYLIDFDRGRLMKPGSWCQSNLDRLARSLAKIRASSAGWHASDTDWETLLAAYRAG